MKPQHLERHLTGCYIHSQPARSSPTLTTQMPLENSCDNFSPIIGWLSNPIISPPALKSPTNTRAASQIFSPMTDLGNVLHYRSYGESPLGYTDRQQLIEGRVLAWHVLKWLDYTIQIHPNDDSTTILSIEEDIYYSYLSSVTISLCGYKKQAQSTSTEGPAHFTLHDLQQEIQLAFHDNVPINRAKRSQKDHMIFDFPGPIYSIRPISGSHNDESKHRQDDGLGETYSDWVWKASQVSHWHRHSRGLVNKLCT